MAKTIPTSYTKANTPQLRTRAALRASSFTTINQNLNFLFARGGTRCGGYIFDPAWESTSLIYSQDPTGAGDSFDLYTPVGVFDRFLEGDVVKIGVAVFGEKYDMALQVRRADDLSTVAAVTFTDGDRSQPSWTTGIVSVDKVDTEDGSGNPSLLYLFIRSSAEQSGDTAKIYQYEAGSLIIDSTSDLPTTG